MTGAPQITPALGTCPVRFGANVTGDIDGTAFGKSVGIEPRGDDRGPKHVGLQTGERAREQDVVGGAGDQHFLIGMIRHTLTGRDELRAHIREIAAEHLGGK